MPAMLKFENGDYAFVVTPQFVGKAAETIYWVGSFANEKFTPYDNEPKKFEHLTRHLLSPSFGYDEAGRLTYIGIVPEDRDVNDQIAAGWRHTFSLPRVARLLGDGQIGHYPHPNLCRLRQDSVHIENRTIAPGANFNLPEIEGNQYEINAVLVPQPESKFSLQILKNATASLFTGIDCDLKINRLGLNRTLSSPYPTTEDNRFDDYVFGDTVRLRVFVDHSIAEVFVDNLTVISARVYPGEDQKLIDLVVPEGSVKIERLDFCELGGKEELYEPEVCEPDFLPAGFLTSVFDFPENVRPLSLYPNPVHDSLLLEFSEIVANQLFEMKIYDSSGRVMMQHSAFETREKIDVSRLPKGQYMIALSNQSGAFAGKFIKQ